MGKETPRLRIFHINQFPTDRMFVLLEKNFHIMLFKELRNYEFKGLNNLFFNNRLNWNTFKQWKQRKNFIPLWFIVELSKKFPEFSIQKFEENILAYKGPSNSSIIKNPKLPLKENKNSEHR